ncbi:MAG: VTT domain-containing protein [Nanoarchaeota archaeon]|nr:VTT domain-containing protein [Nanoarchaeota archaeon]
MVLEWFVQTFGYLGIFIASAVMTANILIPYPATIISFVGGAAFNPLLVGISAGLGAAIGELTGYGLGYGGKKILLKKMKKSILKKQWTKTKKAFHKHGGLLIFFMAVTPLPDDLLGMFCGATHYDVKKFLFFAAAGKIVLYTIFAVTGNTIFSFV